MPSGEYIPEPLTAAELRRIVQDALAGSPERNPETFHARYDHPERGLSLDDVIHGLEGEWNGFSAERFDRDNWQWRYRITTEDIDGEKILTIILAVDTRNRDFTVITRWEEKGG